MHTPYPVPKLSAPYTRCASFQTRVWVSMQISIVQCISQNINNTTYSEPVLAKKRDGQNVKVSNNDNIIH